MGTKATRRKLRWIYCGLFGVILLTEILIALFVRDAFIRPYGGDILVTVLLCCMVRIVIPDRCFSLPLWVFLFAAAVEVGQYFDYVTLLGLGDVEFFRILMGTSFSWVDMLCYAAGCAVFFGCEWLFRKNGWNRIR